MNNKLEAVIFDMDGVLIDTEYTFLESKFELLKDAGYDKDISYQYQFMGTTYESMWTKMKEELNLPLPIKDYIADMNQRRLEMVERDGILPVANAPEFVKRLADSGIKVALASSSPKVDINFAMKEIGIYSCFDALVSGEEVAHSKPQPDVFLEAARQVGANPKHCVVVEDTTNGMLAGKRGGMYVVGFANPKYPSMDLSHADKVIKDFAGIDLEDLQNWFDMKETPKTSE